jgi:hypothetical protein
MPSSQYSSILPRIRPGLSRAFPNLVLTTKTRHRWLEWWINQTNHGDDHCRRLCSFTCVRGWIMSRTVVIWWWVLRKLATSTSKSQDSPIHGAGDELPREWPWFCGATGRGTLGVLVFLVALSRIGNEFPSRLACIIINFGVLGHYDYQ